MPAKGNSRGRHHSPANVSTISESKLIKPPSKQPSQQIDPLLTDFDLERVTGRARSSWQKARLTGGGPPFIRLGRLVRYRQSDVEGWLSAHASLRSTSEAV
jgi:predicted DNA-binding transcriptional regulator AlpA